MSNSKEDFAMSGETFIRRAFGRELKAPHGMIDRFADPAGLANTDAVSGHNIDFTKIGIGYAATILIEQAGDKQYTEIEGLISQIMAASSVSEMFTPLDKLRDIQDNLPKA